MIDYVGIFPNGEISDSEGTPSEHLSKDKKKKEKKKDPEIIAAVDTEYTRIDEYNNLCLSFQFAVYNTKTGTYETKITYIDDDKRLSSNDVFQTIYDLAGVLDAEIVEYRITLVCHFCAAEFSMFSNRKQISKYFDFAYNTLLTYRSIRFPFKLKSEKVINIKLILGDTMLLLPLSHRTLEKASSLLDEKYHKKPLTVAEKEDMLTLLKCDPDRFEEYAVHDAVITLMLFIKLQYILNTINGSTNIRFTTIGSATVKIYKKYILKHFPEGTFESQFTQDNSIYQKGLNLAQRAYLGGLNNSYVVGEVKGELILDIDFSSAYPSVMGMLPIADFGTAPEVIEYKVLKKNNYSLGLGDD